jgi:hypothetical protein
MPPRPRRTAPARRGSARRKLVWATSSNLNQSIGQTPGNYDLLANLRVAGSSVLGATVMRVHMDISVLWSAVTPATSNGLAIGFCVEDTDLVTAQDITPGAQGRDWMLREDLFPGTGLNTASIAAASPVEGFRVDLRAKRKVQELNQTLAFVIQNTAAAGGLPVSFFARVLIALP